MREGEYRPIGEDDEVTAPDDLRRARAHAVLLLSSRERFAWRRGLAIGLWVGLLGAVLVWGLAL